MSASNCSINSFIRRGTADARMHMLAFFFVSPNFAVRDGDFMGTVSARNKLIIIIPKTIGVICKKSVWGMEWTPERSPLALPQWGIGVVDLGGSDGGQKAYVSHRRMSKQLRALNNLDRWADGKGLGFRTYYKSI